MLEYLKAKQSFKEDIEPLKISTAVFSDVLEPSWKERNVWDGTII